VKIIHEWHNVIGEEHVHRMQARSASEEEKVKVDFLFYTGHFQFVNGIRHKYGPQHPSEKQEHLSRCGLNKMKVGLVETQPHEAFRKLLHCEQKRNRS